MFVEGIPTATVHSIWVGDKAEGINQRTTRNDSTWLVYCPVNQRVGGGGGLLVIVKYPAARPPEIVSRCAPRVLRWRFLVETELNSKVSDVEWSSSRRSRPQWNICTHIILTGKGYLYFMVWPSAKMLVGVCTFSNQHPMLVCSLVHLHRLPLLLRLALIFFL